MHELPNRHDQPPAAQTGEELLALIPSPTSANIERIAFIDKTRAFIEAHTGEVGEFFWGVAITTTEHHAELGFKLSEDLSNLDIAT